MHSKKSPNKFLVMEGNRRVFALKLLNNSALANGTQWENKFSKLSEKYKKTTIKKIDVIIENNEEEVLRLIELRHNGKQNGAGLSSWNPQQATRAEIRRSGTARRYAESIELIDYAIRQKLLGEDTENKLKNKKFPLTTLERISKDKYVCQQIGIEYSEHNGWQLTKLPVEAHKGITRILSDLAKGLSVSVVKSKELRKLYVDNMGKDLPDSKSKLQTPLPVSAVVKQSDVLKKRAIKDPRKRKNLIDESIPVSEKNIIKIYMELRNHIDLTSTPNAAACLLRVFTDQSLDYFIKIKKIMVTGNTQAGGRHSMKDRMKATGKYLADNHLLDKKQAKAISEACNKNSGIVDPDNLHLRLHSQHHLSTQSDLTHMWDSVYGALLMAIWQNA
jgi:hypothetical protein